MLLKVHTSKTFRWLTNTLTDPPLHQTFISFFRNIIFILIGSINIYVKLIKTCTRKQLHHQTEAQLINKMVFTIHNI